MYQRTYIFNEKLTLFLVKVELIFELRSNFEDKRKEKKKFFS